MQKTKYLIRLDDACPYMDKGKWQRMEDILDRYVVRPLVGIIPANEDPETLIDCEDKEFWDKVHKWKSKDWAIALHGFNHVCTTQTGGLNPIHNRSEFAGLSFDVQKEKIASGYSILKNNGIEVEWFFAPSHTFDENTLTAIKECTPIRHISDMIATKPFEEYGFTFVPCQMGKLRNMPIPGYWCASYHPNIMKEEDFDALEDFLMNNCSKFISFGELPKAGKKELLDNVLSFAYYTLRKIKG